MVLISDALFFGHNSFVDFVRHYVLEKRRAVWEISVSSIHQLQWSEASTLLSLGGRAVLSPATQAKCDSYFYIEQCRKKCVKFKVLRTK